MLTPAEVRLLYLFRWRDGKTRVDHELLYPGFLRLLLACLAACERRGALYYLTRGCDDFDAQAALHAAHLAGGPRAAPAGYSGHQYGLAVDGVRDADTSQPGVQITPASWLSESFAVLREEAERVGLVSGGSFKGANPDWPHVQLAGFVTAKQLEPLRAIYLAAAGDRLAKLRAVWRHLDSLPLPAVAG